MYDDMERDGNWILKSIFFFVVLFSNTTEKIIYTIAPLQQYVFHKTVISFIAFRCPCWWFFLSFLSYFSYTYKHACTETRSTKKGQNSIKLVSNNPIMIYSESFFFFFHYSHHHQTYAIWPFLLHLFSDDLSEIRLDHIKYNKGHKIGSIFMIFSHKFCVCDIYICYVMCVSLFLVQKIEKNFKKHVCEHLSRLCQKKHTKLSLTIIVSHAFFFCSLDDYTNSFIYYYCHLIHTTYVPLNSLNAYIRA